MTLREQFTRMDIIFSTSIFLTISQDTITDVLPILYHSLTLDEYDIATSSQLSTMDT
jgi:hypothetical protein